MTIGFPFSIYSSRLHRKFHSLLLTPLYIDYPSSRRLFLASSTPTKIKKRQSDVQGFSVSGRTPSHLVASLLPAVAREGQSSEVSDKPPSTGERGAAAVGVGTSTSTPFTVPASHLC
jgi:hypothetical protein